jgi:hypothetical protein
MQTKQILETIKSQNPIHEEEGKWYFWDETWADRYGPYTSETECRQELDKYIKWLDGPAVPNPGSKEAIELGCTCPVMDNCNGKGFKLKGETCFWYTGGCPVHSFTFSK